MRYLVYSLSCLLASISPLIMSKPEPKLSLEGFTGWQTSFEGKPIKKLPLSKIEQTFSESFPGYVGRFDDGKRQIIIRWVKEETRKLHPASDCYRGIGYKIKALPAFKDKENKYWSRFSAKNNNENLTVSERIYDDSGNSWLDASSWYWSAFLHKSNGPWSAITISEPS